MEEKPTEQNHPQDSAEDSEKKAKPGKIRRSHLQSLKDENVAFKKELEDASERYLRLAAEFDNFRKRKQKESSEWSQSARENVLKELLPVVDDFERVFRNHAGDSDSQWQGVSLIHDKLMTILKSQGLTPMDSMGKPFDPVYHDALLTVPRDDVAPGTVVDVHENGYLLNDRVLRHAKVIVSRELESDTQQDEETADTAKK
jgi:molecular chaperone GrpE